MDVDVNYSVTPYCIYQFSFDRIDNTKIHSIANLRIVREDVNTDINHKIERINLYKINVNMSHKLNVVINYFAIGTSEYISGYTPLNI